MPPAPPHVTVSEQDRELFAETFAFFEPYFDDVNAEVERAMYTLPAWAPIIGAVAPDQLRLRGERSREVRRAALVGGDWRPFIADLRDQGMLYARLGVSFAAWYDLLVIYRSGLRARILELTATDRERAVRISDGMSRLIDIAMLQIGEAYIATKEAIIAEQQEAIREVSLPVLQVRERMLVVPLVGLVDSTRARRLIETVLTSIRDRRARGVVLDVTGVPVVDSAVANHLVQVCDAARLMGSTVAITGISPEIAQTLAALGARLPSAETLGDLQEGIEHMERLLA